MPTITLQIVTGLIGLIALWIKEYYTKDRTYETIQDGRTDVVDGCADAVNSRIDRLLVKNSNLIGNQSDVDTAERLGKVLGEGVVSE